MAMTEAMMGQAGTSGLSRTCCPLQCRSCSRLVHTRLSCIRTVSITAVRRQQSVLHPCRLAHTRTLAPVCAAATLEAPAADTIDDEETIVKPPPPAVADKKRSRRFREVMHLTNAAIALAAAMLLLLTTLLTQASFSRRMLQCMGIMLAGLPSDVLVSPVIVMIDNW